MLSRFHTIPERNGQTDSGSKGGPGVLYTGREGGRCIAGTKYSTVHHVFFYCMTYTGWPKIHAT